MDLFNISKSNNNFNMDSMIAGFFRIETSKLLGMDSNSKEYDEKMTSSSELIETYLVPRLNKQIQQNVVKTLQSISSERVHEIYSEYLFLLFVQYREISKDILSGKIKSEEASPDFLAMVLHEKVKQLIEYLK